MNLRNLCDRMLSSILAPAVVGSLIGLGAHSASAQSLIVTTPFSYCVNSQAYPVGKYQFTLISPWILSIRNVSGGAANFFAVHPEQDFPHGRVSSAGGVIFATYQGVRALQAVYEPGSRFTSELISQGVPGDKLQTHRSFRQINCFSEGSSMRDRNRPGQ
jgi:hypothetical protein